MGEKEGEGVGTARPPRHRMTTIETIRIVADRRSLAVGLVYDPDADEGERWTATVGLDASGAARTPELALCAALLDPDAEETVSGALARA